LNAALAKTPFLGGERCGFTDVALCPFVRQFAATDRAWFDSLPLPALQAWLDGMLTSELFASIMTRYPQWKADEPPPLFA
jgi:glutathione S-transferase